LHEFVQQPAAQISAPLPLSSMYHNVLYDAYCTSLWPNRKGKFSLIVSTESMRKSLVGYGCPRVCERSTLIIHSLSKGMYFIVFKARAKKCRLRFSELVEPVHVAKHEPGSESFAAAPKIDKRGLMGKSRIGEGRTVDHDLEI